MAVTLLLMSAPNPEPALPPPTSPAAPHPIPKLVPPVAPPPVGEAALSAEEQMERFAQDLKENDWGHQPC